MAGAAMSDIYLAHEGTVCLMLPSQDPLTVPVGDSLFDPLAPEEAQEEKCDLRIVNVWHELIDDRKVELKEGVSVKTEPQIFELETQPVEVKKACTEETENTEMILPDYCVVSSVKVHEPAILETEYRLPVYSDSSEVVKNELLDVQKTSASPVVEMYVERQDHHIKLEPEEDGFEFTVIKEEEEEKDDRILKKLMDEGEPFPSGHNVMLPAKQYFSESDKKADGEDSHYTCCFHQYGNSSNNQQQPGKGQSEEKQLQFEDTDETECTHEVNKNKPCNYDNCVKKKGPCCSWNVHHPEYSEEIAFQSDQKETGVFNLKVKNRCKVDSAEQRLCKCEHCRQRITSKYYKEGHIQTVHLKQYESQHCGQMFGQNLNSKEHGQVVHLEEKQDECQHCQLRFDNENSRQQHIKTVHRHSEQHKCQYCEQLFGKSFNLEQHIKTIHLKIKLFECQHCGHKFTRSFRLKHHIQAVHLKKKLYECLHCGKRFSDLSSRQRHIKTVHLKLKQFQCQHCEKAFDRSYIMKKHINIVHLNMKPFECQHCKKRFSDNSNMKQHIKAVHLKLK